MLNWIVWSWIVFDISTVYLCKTELFEIELFLYLSVYEQNNCNDALLELFKVELFLIFIINGFWTIVYIFIVISKTFRPICPPAFFKCLSNSGTFTELRTTSFIESTGVTCSDSVSHNQVHVLSIPVLLLACNQDWTCNLQIIVSLEA